MPKNLRIFLLLAPGLGLVVVMMTMVIWRAVSQSFGLYNFGGEDALTLSHWQEMLNNRRYWNALSWSAYIAITSSLLAVALAYPLAIWLRRPFRGSTFLSAMIKAPYFVPGLVAAFLLVNVISFHGLLNQIMVGLGFIDRPIRMQNDANGYGIIALQVWKQLPLAFLLVSGSVQMIPDQVLHAAQDMGAGVFARFRKVVLPLTAGAMQASLILIFINVAGDFTFQAVAGPVRENSMATLMTQLQGENYNDWNGAAVVGVSLMALSLVGAVLLAVVVQSVTRAMARAR